MQLPQPVARTDARRKSFVPDSGRWYLLFGAEPTMSLFLEPYCSLRKSYDIDVIALLLNESDPLRAVAG